MQLEKSDKQIDCGNALSLCPGKKWQREIRVQEYRNASLKIKHRIVNGVQRKTH